MDDATLARLLTDLASPDPAVRDEKAFSALAQAINDGELTQKQLDRVGATMRERLQHHEIQARTFGVLVLAVLVDAGHWDDAWFTDARDWYLGETDLRGYDETLGWLHAVAHGADFFGECAANGRASGEAVLDVLATRCVTPTDHVWRDQEEVRVATAIAMALSDEALNPQPAIAWLAPVAKALSDADAPSPQAWWSNTVRALQTLHVALDHEILHGDDPITIAHRERVRDAVAQTIELTQPWFWRTARRRT